MYLFEPQILSGDIHSGIFGVRNRGIHEKTLPESASGIPSTRKLLNRNYHSSLLPIINPNIRQQKSNPHIFSYCYPRLSFNLFGI